MSTLENYTDEGEIESLAVGDFGFLGLPSESLQSPGEIGVGAKISPWVTSRGDTMEYQLRTINASEVVQLEPLYRELARRFYERRGFLPSVLEMRRFQQDDR